MVARFVLGFLLLQVRGEKLNSDMCGINSVLQGSTSPFIVSGNNNLSYPGVWPWVCSVGFSGDTWDHQCGGVVVTDTMVVTAAHCPVTFETWNKEEEITVRCGDFHLQDPTDDIGVQVRNVELYHIHPGYTYSSARYDIAVLVLEAPLKLTEYVRPLCLEDSDQFSSSDAAVAIGWGKDENSEYGQDLRLANVQIFSEEYCKERLPDVSGFGSDLFCAADLAGSGRGTCYGDSGSPILTFNSEAKRYEMKGIVQGGARCGSFESPDLYVSISEENVRTWIDKIVTGEEFLLDQCFQNQICVSRDHCEYIGRLYNTFEDLETTEKGKRIVKSRLRSKICNRETKLFCCAPETFNINNGSIVTPTHTDKDILVLSTTKLINIPGMTPVQDCTLPKYPQKGLIVAVSGIVDGKLVICGGPRNGVTSAQCHTLQPTCWQHSHSLSTERAYAASSSYSGGMLVTGGYNNQWMEQNSTELVTGSGVGPGPRLPVRLFGHCQVTVGSMVYVIGGHHGGRTSTVYALHGNEWIRVRDMKMARKYHCCVVQGELVYVIGGSGNATSAMEVYNTVSDSWNDGPSLVGTEFRDGECLVVDGEILALHGDGDVYNISTDGWDRYVNIGKWAPAGFRAWYGAQLVSREMIYCPDN